MARILTSIGAIRGGVGALVFESGQYGPRVRLWSPQRGKGGQHQSIQRGVFQAVACAWQTTGEARRAAWAAWAATEPEPGRRLSAAGWFTRLNSWRAESGRALLTVPPSTHAGAEIASITYARGAEYDWSPDRMRVTFAPAAIGAGYEYVLRATAPSRSDSVGAVWHKRLRVLLRLSGTSASPVDIASAFSDRFGAAVVGTFVALEVALYRHTDLSGRPMSYLSRGVCAGD